LLSLFESSYEKVYTRSRVPKEAYPYDYHSSDRVIEGKNGIIEDAVECVKECNRDLFRSNVVKYAAVENDKVFDMRDNV